MEENGGAAITNLRVRDGKRLSVFRTYVYPLLDKPNLTVLTNVLITKVIFEGKRATGVEMFLEGETRRVAAGAEVILSRTSHTLTDGFKDFRSP